MLAADVKLNKHDIKTIEYSNNKLIINQNLFNFLFLIFPHELLQKN